MNIYKLLLKLGLIISAENDVFVVDLLKLDQGQTWTVRGYLQRLIYGKVDGNEEGQLTIDAEGCALEYA